MPVLRRLPRLGPVVALILLLAVPAPALITVGKGNAPVSDVGWPTGAVDVANLKSRVGWYEGPPLGGGESVFLYRGDMQALNEALKTFAAVRAPALQIVLHDGPQHNQFLGDPKDKDADTRYDWSFTVWVPESWHRLYNDPRSTFMADQANFRQPVAAPRVDVYLTPKIDWKKVSVPDGVPVIDRRVGGQPPAQGAMIRAEVYDMASGKPVPDAQLSVDTQAPPPPQGAGPAVRRGRDWNPVVSATGDKLGRVELAKIPAGHCRLVVTAPGYAPRVIGFEQFRDGAARKLTVELSKAVKLTGTVTNVDGKPLPGISVRASNMMGIDGRGYATPAAIEAVTDDKGQFTFTDLPAGYTQAWAHAKGWFHSSGMKLHAVPEQRSLTLPMVATGTLKGRLLDKNGKPATTGNVNATPPGEQIGKWGGSTNVKPDGTWQFDEVPPGPYTVSSRPDLPGIPADPNAQQITVVSGKTIEIELKQP